ncbi:MAG: hypothetical protein JWO25_1308 [Alphaproteobacteria bacterium]|nr:hypothetical protein [Alphaproteobacteria bacterium]
MHGAQPPEGGGARRRPAGSTAILGARSLRLAVDSPLPFSRQPLSRGRRATSLVLALAITLLIILGFLGLNGAVPTRPQFKGGPLILNLAPDAEKPAAKKKAVAKVAATTTPPPPQPRPKPIVKLPTPPSEPPTEIIKLTPEEDDKFTQSMRHGPVAPAAGQQQASSAGDSQAVGTAPNGEPLYEAQWYRRPTHAELSAYLPRHMPDEGWGLVACRTVARYHVEDCVELGSSPPGSHLAGVVRQAAWQFLVRPPRLGGKELVGTWVRIRIDYTQKAVE